MLVDKDNDCAVLTNSKVSEAIEQNIFGISGPGDDIDDYCYVNSLIW